MKVRHSQFFFVKLALLLLVLLWGCERSEEPVKVALANLSPLAAKPTVLEGPHLRIAVAAVISPEESFILYKELLKYISGRLGMPLEFVQRETYAEINDLLRTRELDLAFVCSGAYVEGHDQFGMELLVAPVAHGEAVYYSYIIVPTASPAQALGDLRAKRFAFTDPMSNTGKLAPTSMLDRMGERPESFFSETIYTHSHDRSIEMVANNLVDGAAVDSLIFDYLRGRQPELARQIRIVKKSEPYGIPPVVVPRDLAPELKEKLRDLFMAMPLDAEGRTILKKLRIDRFIVLEDRHYDSIRRMKTASEKK